ncbi:rubredoxin [Candidatus Woesearchaeota archaeon]|nr:rubredoxin [Candidatus Woesearchaeota archaeon]
MNLFRCGVCALVYDGDDAPDKCPKCGATKENFSKIEGESADLIEKSRRTNEYHVAIMGLYSKIRKWASIIKEENLDPNCVLIANRVLKDTYETIQSIKAELEAHMKKGKWG